MTPPRPYDSETDQVDHYVEPATDPGAEVVEEGLRALDGAGNEALREELEWALTPGSQEKEEPASNGTKVTTDDRACKSWFEETPSTDPGARAPRAALEAANWDYDVDEFAGVYNPLTRSTQTVKLRWGTKAWGYRHIVLRHGWNPAMRARTALALEDPAPQPDRTPGSFAYLGNLSEGPAGIRCRQRVIVSYDRDGTVPVGRHIITSFLEAY